jgi:hypothetical protein
MRIISQGEKLSVLINYDDMVRGGVGQAGLPGVAA